MSTTIKDSPAGAPAPATPGVPTPATAFTNGAPSIADEADLFTPVARKRQALFLPDREQTINLEALTPLDYDEVNHAATVYEGDTQKIDSRLWNSRLTARAMRRPDWRRMYKDDSAWRMLAHKIAEFWTIADTRLAAETVAELSGISAKARQATDDLLGKGSGGTATAGGSTS